MLKNNRVRTDLILTSVCESDLDTKFPVKKVY